MVQDSQLIKKESDIINILRLVLTVGVVFTHSAIDVPQPHTFNNASYVIAEGFWQRFLGEFRVPTFFMLSGVLFFKGAYFNLIVYRKKIRKRLHSLLYPYLLWCAIALSIRIVLLFMKTGNFPFNNPAQVLLSFIYYNGTVCNPFPINGPLWYMRDLFLIVIISPLLFQLVKGASKCIIVALFCFFIVLPYLHLPMTLFLKGIIWFTMGAYISVHNKTLISIFSPMKLVYYIYPICIVVNVLVWDSFWEYGTNQIVVIFGTVFIIKTTIDFCKKYNCQIGNSVGALAMFVYCSHFIVDYIRPVICHLYDKKHFVLSHISTGTCTIVICVVIYYILSKNAPKLLGLLIGNR